MPRIDLQGLEKTAEQASGWHHPHYTGITPNARGQFSITFKPFTGSESEPTRPAEAHRDPTLTHAARDFLAREYEAAADLWREARYIRDLKDAADGAAEAWTAYDRARQMMNELRRTLDTTPDDRWTSTVSQLISAHAAAEEAARVWDSIASRIAAVHDRNLYSDLMHAEAYKKAGLVADGWAVGCAYEYKHSTGPVTDAVRAAIRQQRSHIKQVSGLTRARQG